MELTNDPPVRFTSTEIIRNLSSRELYTDELHLLCSGLRFSIPSLKMFMFHLKICINLWKIFAMIFAFSKSIKHKKKHKQNLFLTIIIELHKCDKNGTVALQY